MSTSLVAQISFVLLAAFAALTMLPGPDGFSTSDDEDLDWRYKNEEENRTDGSDGR